MSQEKDTHQPMTEQEKNAFIAELMMQARILGGPQVMLAMDRIACPKVSTSGIAKLQDSMNVFTQFLNRLDPERRTKARALISAYLRPTVEEIGRLTAGQATKEKAAAAHQQVNGNEDIDDHESEEDQEEEDVA